MADVKASTEVRELAVALAIADAATGNGAYRLGDLASPSGSDQYGFDVPYTERPYESSNGETVLMKEIDYQGEPGWADGGYNDVNQFSSSVFDDGASFCAALRASGINVDAYGELACETDWKNSFPRLARMNYALGSMIAEYFGIGPNTIEGVRWYGPQNLSGDARNFLPPADIGIKLLGTPERSFEMQSSYVYDGRPDDDWLHLVEYGYFDTDSDIMISLKDGSDVLGSMGFSNFANLILDVDYGRGADFFELYAPTEYDSWFDTAWRLFIDWLYDNDFSFSATGSTGSLYNAWIENDGEIIFEKSQNGKTYRVISPFDTTRQEWRANKCSEARQVFSKWCTAYGNKMEEYVLAQRTCSTVSAKVFGTVMSEQGLTERFYELVGWRMSEYYYAKIEHSREGDKMVLCAVPSVFNANLYDTKVTITGDPVTTDEDPSASSENLTTQSIVPFSISCEELEMNANFRLVIRFTDGTFNAPPLVHIETMGEFPGTYYALYNANVSDYLPG